MKTAKQRVCELHRLAMLSATLLITLSGLAIRTYFTGTVSDDFDIDQAERVLMQAQHALAPPSRSARTTKRA